MAKQICKHCGKEVGFTSQVKLMDTECSAGRPNGVDSADGSGSLRCRNWLECVKNV